jgi:hypothetical protein
VCSPSRAFTTLGDGFQKGLLVGLGQICMVHRLLQNALGKSLRFIDMEMADLDVITCGVGGPTQKGITGGLE